MYAPHTEIIRHGKKERPTESGHKVWLDEVEVAIVSKYRVLTGNPQGESQWAASDGRRAAQCHAVQAIDSS
jgi:IS5 family transposase